MSGINRRLINAIEDGNMEPEIKELLKNLLAIELRNFNDNYPRFSEDYDRIIIRVSEKRRKKK